MIYETSEMCGILQMKFGKHNESSVIFYVVCAVWQGRKSWIQTSVLTLTSFVALDELFNFNKLHFLFQKTSTP